MPPLDPPDDSALGSRDRSPERMLGELCQVFQRMDSVVVCFSGGIDSALLLVIAHRELGDRAIALTAVSDSLPQAEREAATSFARSVGARHALVESAEMLRPGYAQNGPDRCFHCKTELYEIARRKQLDWGARFVVNGTNTDDLGDYRPGLLAAEQAQIRSPFLEARMSKADVRAVAKLLELSNWDKPAAACLSSRLPYGVAVTKERLLQVEQFEARLQKMGFRQVRVRYHHELARIEVPRQDLGRLMEPSVHERVVELGKECGFRFVTLDLAGYRTGSLNELLTGRSLRVVS